MLSNVTRAVVAGFATALLALPASAAAQQPPDRAERLAAKAAQLRAQNAKAGDSSLYITDQTLPRPLQALGHQHGGEEGHLLPTRRNVRLVSKLSPRDEFGSVVPEQIADLAVHRGHAYLNSWAEPTCTRGGTYVVNIRQPERPRELDFVKALPGNYHGEGAHALRVNTRFFNGDLLAVNNERCADVERGGGFDLYDVSNPRRPRILVQGFGDTGPDDGSLTGNEPVHDSHSTFVWQDGSRVYLMAGDNFELHDVDIFEITDPRNPRPVAEFDLIEEFPEIVDGGALGNLFLNHDFVVKQMDGVQTALLSYWDAGYVKLDVDNPANPIYLGDSSFDGPDPLTGLEPQEGNAHQAEFSFDDRFILAADEDFAPYRLGTFSITTGDNAGEYPGEVVAGGAAPAALPDLTMNGPTAFGGYGCNESAPVPQREDVELPPLESGEEAILVLQRGPTNDPAAPEAACFPGEKAANAAAAGWDAVLLVNRHLGSADADVPFCGSGGFPPGAGIVTICTTHTAFHRLFGSEPRYEVPYAPGDYPALETPGEKVEANSQFDGWGYPHLYRNKEGKLTEVDAYAIPEALDPRFAFGFGDLSIHEFATDPEARLAYSSYYSGGLRVFRFGPRGLRETGRFIDEGGNNFWGVEQFTSGGERLVAASDRDFGLYLFRYTGPGSG